MKPIIFSTPMVQAILAGRKTQTRRVIRIHPRGTTARYPENRTLCTSESDNPFLWGVCGLYKPSYRKGDILWVRETYFVDVCNETCAGRADENECPYMRSGNKCYGYKAQFDQDNLIGIKWRPSIHMPREAARIFLRVTYVRGERLQEITPEDAWAEGCEHIASFEWLWDSIYINRGHGWNSNPWIWVYTFERCDAPVGWP